MTIPYFVKGIVVKGFGRGSKQLGIPTANFPIEVVKQLPECIKTGIYFGFATVDKSEVFKMVMSIGWNPYFQNTQKSMEIHIIHQFDEDFYGLEMKACILGFMRPEKSFDSLDALILAIHNDIEEAKRKLGEPEFEKYKMDVFFHT